MSKQIELGILLFNEVEVLDFAGPFEVFSIASQNGKSLFKTSTVSETGQVISARNGLKVVPDYSFANAPQFDILIIPGGYGAEHVELRNANVIRWITSQYKNVELLASVCTGAFILAEAGLLDNLNVTTHWMDLERLEKDYPKISVIKGEKFVDQEKIITSGGISSGITMSLYIIERFFHRDIAIETAKRMEYPYDI